MALRARCGVASLSHRTAYFKGGFAGLATEVVQRHVPECRRLLDLCHGLKRPDDRTPRRLDNSRPRLDEDTQTGEPTVAHIVKVDPGESAQAKVMEARIYGTPLEALCGHVWVPSRDPKKLPMCEDCKSIYEMYRMMNDGLNDQPSD